MCVLGFQFTAFLQMGQEKLESDPHLSLCIRNQLKVGPRPSRRSSNSESALGKHLKEKASAKTEEDSNCSRSNRKR